MRARVNGVELFFDVLGPGARADGARRAAKPALVALHGGPGLDHAQWVPWLEPLADDLQIVVLDHRGNGRSSRPPLADCTLEAMADDVAALVGLLGLDDVTLLGHSFGGMVALVHALRHPGRARRLILSATAPSREFVDDAWAAVSARGTPAEIEAARHVLSGTLRDAAHFREAFGALAPLYQRRAVEPAPDRTVVNVDMLDWFFSVGVKDYDVRARLGEIAVPVLVLAGRHDWICPPAQAEILARGIPGARLVVFEESAHRLLREEPEKFLAAVREFASGSRQR